MGGIKCMYVDIVALFRDKGDESERFRIDSGVRQGCIMSLLLFTVYIDAVMKEVKRGMGRRKVKFMEEEEERMEITWPLLCR